MALNLALLAEFGPLLPTVADSRAAGALKRTFESDFGVPIFKMHVYTHGGLTVGVPYVVGFTAAHPLGVTSAAATNPKCLIGVASETTTAAGYTDVIVAGLAEDAVTSGAIPADSGVEVINAGAAFIDDGADAPIQTANSAGVALTAAAANIADILLYGTPVAIAAA